MNVGKTFYAATEIWLVYYKKDSKMTAQNKRFGMVQ